MTRGRTEVISIFAISLAVLLLFSMLNLVSAEQPSGHSCYDDPGFRVYIKSLPGCNNIDCSKCETATGSPCTGTPAPTYYDCKTSEWDCNLLNVDNIDPEKDFECKTSGKYVGVYMGKSSMTTLVPVENIKGYYVTYPDACIQGARFFERWDINFNRCIELVNGKEIYHGFLIGTGCSTDTEIVSTSATEFGQTAIKYQRCSGWCPPPHVFSCSPPGIPVTETGCQENREVCYKGWNDTNKNGYSEETKGYCDDGECKNLNFWIESVSPIQVLEGFDWIENKPGMIRVKANFDNKFKPVEQYPNEKQNVNVKLTLWKRDDNSLPFPITWIKQWEKNYNSNNIKRVYNNVEKKHGEDTVNLFDIKISSTGTYKFEVIVDPDNSVIEWKEDDNKKESGEFYVNSQGFGGLWGTEEAKFNVIYVPVRIGSWRNGVNMDEVRRTIDRNQKFLEAVYPIDPKQLNVEIKEPFYPKKDIPPNPGYLKDSYPTAYLLPKLSWKYGSLDMPMPSKRIVGIVPKDSISGEGISPLLRISGDAVLIAGGAAERTAAHEITHSLGIHSMIEEYTWNPTWGNALNVDGWRVEKKNKGAIINIDKHRSPNNRVEDLREIIDGKEFNRWFCMMGDAISGSYWIDTEDYRILLNLFKY